MLSDPLLIKLVEDGILVPWTPGPALPMPVVRHLLLVPEVHAEIIKEPWTREVEDKSDKDARDRRRALHALLNNFIGGRRMSPDVDVKILKPVNMYLNNLLEMRSGPPRPQARIFVQVYGPGVWIGLKFASRDKLGAFGDPRWEVAAQEVKGRWAKIFGSKKCFIARYPCDFPELRKLADA